MTIMRVALIGVELTPDRKAELARRLIAAFCEVEVGRDVSAAHGGFVVQIDEVRPGNVFMGDAPMTAASAVGRAAIVTAQVMSGPWSDEMKSSLFERLETVVREVAEIPRQGAGADVWMTIVEIPEGGFALGGRPVSIARLAPVFSEDRQDRIRAYLARKPGSS